MHVTPLASPSIIAFILFLRARKKSLISGDVDVEAGIASINPCAVFGRACLKAIISGNNLFDSGDLHPGAAQRVG